jgi:hypothetical protein
VSADLKSRRDGIEVGLDSCLYNDQLSSSFRIAPSFASINSPALPRYLGIRCKLGPL